MIEALILFAIVFGTGLLLLFGGLVSALEKRTKAEEALAAAQVRQAAALEQMNQNFDLVRQAYVFAVEKQWYATR